MDLIQLSGVPIFEQLQLEEAILRASDRDVLLINQGSPLAIVMGISGKREELIDRKRWEAKPIPIIKRFSGGGTVVVDENTLFVTFICNHDLHDFSPYPEPIMRWTEGIYNDALSLNDFSLRENDYAIGEKKFGGNAQYLTKNRWIHHSTLLWDYDPEAMDLLTLPTKRPTYRGDRNHGEFLTTLSDHLPSKDGLIANLIKSVGNRFPLNELPLDEVEELLSIHHRKATTLLSHIPNATTLNAIEAAEKGDGVNSYDSIDLMWDSLGLY